MSEPTDYLVMCVHSTRRSRAGASAGARETRCHGCRATILLNDAVRAYARRRGVAIYPLCPVCSIAASDPGELVGDALSVPGTAKILEDAGVAVDGEAWMAEHSQRTIHDFAATALRNSVGGQG